jgi:hypothetical protein
MSMMRCSPGCTTGPHEAVACDAARWHEALKRAVARCAFSACMLSWRFSQGHTLTLLERGGRRCCARNPHTKPKLCGNTSAARLAAHLQLL